jgi:hypothetical protein
VGRDHLESRALFFPLDLHHGSDLESSPAQFDFVSSFSDASPFSCLPMLSASHLFGGADESTAEVGVPQGLFTVFNDDSAVNGADTGLAHASWPFTLAI